VSERTIERERERERQSGETESLRERKGEREREIDRQTKKEREELDAALKQPIHSDSVKAHYIPSRFRENTARIRQSRPDCGLNLKQLFLERMYFKPFKPLTFRWTEVFETLPRPQHAHQSHLFRLSFIPLFRYHKKKDL